MKSLLNFLLQVGKLKGKKKGPSMPQKPPAGPTPPPEAPSF